MPAPWESISSHPPRSGCRHSTMPATTNALPRHIAALTYHVASGWFLPNLVYVVRMIYYTTSCHSDILAEDGISSGYFSTLTTQVSVTRRWKLLQDIVVPLQHVRLYRILTNDTSQLAREGGGIGFFCNVWFMFCVIGVFEVLTVSRPTKPGVAKVWGFWALLVLNCMVQFLRV